MKKSLLITFIFLFYLSLGFAGEPRKEPILKIETGTHTSSIYRIDVDKKNRYLITGSYDKTVRVWELSTGKLLKIIRPPIGEGNEGKIFSTAISPDDKVIACGGRTGYEWDDSESIYIFDRQSGELIKRIPNLPNRILNLIYSIDGKYLVASLKLGNGIKIYSTQDYSLIKEDKDYMGDSYGSDFDNDNRLVTTSYDGYIRLYDSNFNLIKKRLASGGKNPFGISFSPDGSKIAVGFNDTNRVEILSSKDLSFLYYLDTSDIEYGNLLSVTWSHDGQYIYAGGSAQKFAGNEWKHFIRKWSKAGKGEYVDLYSGSNTIMDLVTLASGGIAFGSGEPSFGVIDALDRFSIYKKAPVGDFRDNWDGFMTTYDGSTIQFGYELYGKSPARFSLKERALVLMQEKSDTIKESQYLYPPAMKNTNINVENWKNSTQPKINGKLLTLEQYEKSQSIAISPNEKSLLLGADWYLYLFNVNGEIIWKIPAPSTVWAVNISGNGKLAIAAFGDGTIRWYNMADGKELLVFFPHTDRKRWVIWTPSGYYDASPGADDIIGWHINNGKDKAADFFPISKFRSVYYRPDVIAKVLETLDDKEAVRLANEEAGRKQQEVSINQMLPPVVTILSPNDGKEIDNSTLTIKYIIKNPSGEPVTNIKVLLDGRPVSHERGLKIAGKEDAANEVMVSIPEKDTEVSIIAENRYAASDPATIKLKWKGEKNDEFVIKPKLYVLAIGVSGYEDKNLTLSFASKDAKDFTNAMLSQKGKLYRDVEVKLLTDEHATKDEILDGLDWLQRQTTSKDVGIIFLAGHGINDSTGIYYFLPANVNIDKLKRTGVVFSDIKNTVASIPGKVLVFVDTCHSGNIMGAKRGTADITGVINELTSAENGAVVFASATGRQYSYEDPAWGNGAFTKALVEGLSGKADYMGKGKITINMLDLYLSERVKELTKGKQTPSTIKPTTVPDFPIAVKPVSK